MTTEISRCPFCGGEARTFEYDGANQATCGGKHIDCAGTDVVAPVAMWNRRTPAPEGKAWRTVPVEPTEAMIEAANALSGPGTGVNYVQLDPEDFYAAMLAASPVVPVGREEPVARATCQDCGGHIEGWICQSCAREFRENDAGNLVFEGQPVVVKPSAIRIEAADTLERQAAEIERLREALENVLASTVGPEVGAGDGGTFILRSPSPDALRRARAALTGEDPGGAG